MPLRVFADGTVFARTTGIEPVRVLALHGWGRTGADFTETMAGWGGMAIDLPGFGSSPPPAAAGGAAMYAELLEPVMESLPGPVVVVGHSFGARVAVNLAANHPHAVCGLVLTGAPLIRRTSAARPSLGFRLLRRAHRAGLIGDARMEAIRRRRGSLDYRQAEGIMRDVLVTVVNESYETVLDRIRAPVSLVWGSEDRDVPVGVAIATEQRLLQAGVEVIVDVIAGVGHHLPIERPGALRSATGRYL